MEAAGYGWIRGPLRHSHEFIGPIRWVIIAAIGILGRPAFRVFRSGIRRIQEQRTCDVPVSELGINITLPQAFLWRTSDFQFKCGPQTVAEDRAPPVGWPRPKYTSHGKRHPSSGPRLKKKRFVSHRYLSATKG